MGEKSGTCVETGEESSDCLQFESCDVQVEKVFIGLMFGVFFDHKIPRSSFVCELSWLAKELLGIT